MQFNKMSYTSFILLMVMFFPSLIYAPWTEANPPTRPSNEEILMNCAEWINFNGFALDDYGFNREKALSRDLHYDRKASMWAAAYAFKIGGIEEIYQITPQEFCDSFGEINRIPKTFKALENNYESCNGWIQLYGFSENDVSDNKLYAWNTPPSKAKYISIYAYDYWLFLRRPGERSNLNPSEYCSKIGVYESYHRFECPYWSSLTCLDWMIRYEFIYTPIINLGKADSLAREMGNFPLRIHFFPDRYGFNLLAKRHLDWMKLYGFGEDHFDNYTYAMNIDPLKVNYISIWAYSFWEFLHEQGRIYWTTPYDLYSKMGLEDEVDKPFWCDYGTLLTCMEWLILYDMHYLDPAYNLIKAQKLINVLKYIPIRVHYFSERYALDLVAKSNIGHPLNELTPMAFCERFDGNGAEQRSYEFHYEGL